MATCKDCLHWKVCNEYRGAFWGHKAQYSSPIINASADSCIFYKDRSRFVELPCKVGDKVYLDNLHIKYADVIGIYIDAFGGVFDLRVYTNIQLANGFGYEYFISKDYTFEDIGKRIFLTREQAEQALKERERE